MVICSLFMIVQTEILAQSSNVRTTVLDSTVFYLSLAGGANYIMNTSQLPVIRNGSACGQFENGSANAGYFSINGGYKFFDDMLAFETRFFIESRPAVLTTETANYQVLNSTGNYVPLELEHRFAASLMHSALSFGLNYYPLEDYPISIGAAWDWSAPLFSSDYEQTDEILNPSNVRFDGSRTRITGKGDYGGTQSNYGVTGLLRYDLPAGKDLVISPEISYRHGLNSVSSEGLWNQDIIRLGLVVSFDFKIYDRVYGRLDKDPVNQPPAELPSDIVKYDTIQNQTDIVTPIESDNEEQQDQVLVKSITFPSIQMTETVVSQTYPILPYIFFGSGSDDLARRYKSNTAPDTFDEEKLPRSTLDIYYATLDILGSRMIKLPGKITINGYHNGVEGIDANTRDQLALGRANSIKDYLVSKWGIESDRISTSKGNLPPIATSNIYEEGPEENSRAEIEASNPDLIQPIVFKRFLEYGLKGNRLIPVIDVSDGKSIRDIEIFLSSGGQEIFRYSGDPTDLLSKGIPYNERDLQLLAQTLKDGSSVGEISISATITDSENKKYSYESTTPVEKELSDYEVGRINLIVFDFDQASLSEENRSMLDRFAVSDDWEDSEITVTGSTDKLGEPDYNRDLSLARARTTERYLNTINDDLPPIIVKGLGSSELLFDNSLPEGRFYCRTVLIEVKTPIKND